MSKQRHRAKPKNKRKLALERIEALFEQAKEQFDSDPKLSDRYVLLARRIAMKNKVKMPSVFKRQFCRHCHSFLVPGRNARVRTTTKTVTYFCSVCKGFSRFGYHKNPTKVT